MLTSLKKTPDSKVFVFSMSTTTPRRVRASEQVIRLGGPVSLPSFCNRVEAPPAEAAPKKQNLDSSLPVKDAEETNNEFLVLD